MEEGLWGYVLREGRVIKDAPVAFGVAVVLAALLIWGAMEWRYRGPLDSKDATIQGQEATIQSQEQWLAEYREKLKVETPDAAARKMRALEKKSRNLEAQLAKLKERKLTIVEKKLEKNENGTYTIYRLVEVVSMITPAGLYIEVEGRGLISMNVKPQFPQLIAFGPGRKGSDIMYWRTTSPSGRYLITVHAKGPELDLRHKFN